jgi:hypothetical protein
MASSGGGARDAVADPGGGGGYPLISIVAGRCNLEWEWHSCE